MSLTTEEIRELLAVLEASGWDEAQVTVGDVTISVSKGGAGGPSAVASGGAQTAEPPLAAGTSSPGVTPTAASSITGAPSPTEAPEPSESGHVIEAPSVGVFYRSPEPGAPPFVEVDDEVQEGDVLCIVEVMKLMNQVAADAAGTVARVHVKNGEHVEFGAPLFTLTPRAG